MEIASLIKDIRDNGIGLNLSGENLELTFLNEEIDDTLLELVRQNKDRIKEYLQVHTSKEGSESIPKATHKESYPLSNAQKRLWLLCQLEEASVAYNMPFDLELTGNYNVEILKKAINLVVERHEILRTVFRKDNSGEIRQWILPNDEISIEVGYLDLSNIENNQALLKEKIGKDALVPFDLENGPLLRFSFYQLAIDRCVLSFNIHHLISDGWSLHIFSRDVLICYEAIKENKEPILPKLEVQYKDYTEWFLHQLESNVLKDQKDYWLKQLGGELPVFEFPLKDQRSPVKTYNGKILASLIAKEPTKKLKEFTNKNGGSLFMGVLSVLSIVLQRYTNKDDVIVGTPIAAREHIDLTDQIGFYVNTLALRNEVNANDSFVSLFSKVKTTTLNAFVNQQYPFEQLVEELSIKRDLSRNPIFDVMIVLNNNLKSVINNEKAGNNNEEIYEVGSKTSKFDLLFNFEERGEYISFGVEFNTDLYEETLIRQFINHYKIILDQVLGDPNVALGKLNLLTNQEKEQILLTFNDTVKEYKRSTVIGLFEEQVRKTPDHVAVVCGNEQYTYGQLNDYSNKLAHYLRDTLAVIPSQKIGVLLERSANSVLAMIAIIKSGACYVPIDYSYPIERIRYILNDASIDILISQNLVINRLELEEKIIINLDDLDLSKYAKSNPLEVNRMEDPSFVIYTSGSTGSYKGVLQTHKMLSNLIQWNINDSGIDTGLKFLQYTSFSFDVSLQDCWFTLSSGGVLYVVKEELRLNFTELLRYILENGIEVLCFPFSVLNSFYAIHESHSFRNHQIQHIISSGEQLKVNHSLRQFLTENSHVKLHNHYGPAETHVVTSYTMSGKEGNISDYSPIGFPISNTQLYVLDENLQPVPLGVKGEIYIGGCNLATGYLNLADETAKRFINSPFRQDERLYRTGDLAFWRKDGTIIYIGRNDDQVKIRGYRIELKEIEKVLLKYPSIEAAVADVHINKDEEKSLCVYYVSKGKQSTFAIRKYLTQQLPNYMIPSYFIVLESLPLTANGKVNKRMLPQPDATHLVEGAEFLAPKSTIEKAIADIWTEILNVKRVGIIDNFFELGGDSLKAIRIISRIRKEFNKDISYQSFYKNSTIEELAKSLNVYQNELIPKARAAEFYPCTPTQNAIWVQENIKEQENYYNIVFAISIKGKLDINRLEKVFSTLINENEILKTSFFLDKEGTLRQKVNEEFIPFQFSLSDQSEELEEVIKKEYIKRFDLTSAPLLRGTIQKKGENEYNLIITIHHITCDGWSLSYIKKRIIDLYYHGQEHDRLSNNSNRTQFKDYAVWLEEKIHSGALKGQKEYWLRNLDNESLAIDLPRLSFKRRESISSGETVKYSFSHAFLSSLITYSKSASTTLFNVLLSGVKCLLYRYTNQENLVIAVPHANRLYLETESIVGPLLNIILVKSTLDKKSTFKEVVLQVDTRLGEAYQNSLYPYELWSRELKNKAETFNVMVVLQNFSDVFQYQKGGLEFNEYRSNLNPYAQYDIIFRFVEQNGSLHLSIEFKNNLFEKDYIDRLVRHFECLLLKIVQAPEKVINSIDYLTIEEKSQILSFNDTTVEYPKNKNVVDLFEEAVLKFHDKIALKYNQAELTYKELDESSNQFARYILDKANIEREDRIVIKINKSDKLLVALIGILKAGACYVPIDPNYPEERKQYLAKVANCRFSIDENNIEEFLQLKDNYPKESLRYMISPDSLFHIMFTSGTTGKPKGVMLSHRNIVNFITTNDYFPLDKQTVLLSTVATSFDTTNMEFWGVLINGGELVIADRDDLFDYSRLKKTLENNKVNSLWFTASWFSQIADADITIFKNLKQFISGGDILSPKHIKKLKSHYPDLKVVNGYGPTENTTFSTTYQIENIGEGSIPIGKPIKNTRVYILNDALIEQPIGVPGKIYLAGENISVGYFNAPELTSEKFIKNPFETEEVIYDTGDLGRWLPDGNIEFFGRKDNQVKIRGYRVEFNEIESKILTYSDNIEQAVVGVRKQKDEKELVAYIVGGVEIQERELLRYLSKSLPDYMVPSHIVKAEEIPLTPNGKIDRKALSEITIEILIREEGQIPKNEVEKELLEMWKEVFGNNEIRTHSDFFELGGDSLKMITIMNKVNKHYGIEISFGMFYEVTNILELSKVIIEAKSQKIS